MIYRESETVELKEIVIDDIKKEAIAFANCEGGVLYVGINDSGEVVGLEDPEASLMNINNMLRDGIKPDITLFTQSEIEQVEGKSIIIIRVQRGTGLPYYLSGKGIRPEGVFVRHGTSAVHATDTAIRKMIFETDGVSFEATRSLEQALTFESAIAEFASRDIALGEAQLITLKIMTPDRVFTNLGLLLSDQCVHSIKVAIFQDQTLNIFRDRREFKGSLFQQINEVFEYINIHNATEASFDGFHRVDHRDYPEVAIREALLNSVIHRDYAFSGSILIKLFSDRLEFISLGGLLRGLEIEDIRSGCSICRNPTLATVFYRLKLIEAYGTGILRIFESYNGHKVQPEIQVSPNVFKLTLPNLNYKEADGVSDRLFTDQDRVVHHIREHGSISRKETEQLLNLSQTAAGVILSDMIKDGKIHMVGASRNVRYYLQK